MPNPGSLNEFADSRPDTAEAKVVPAYTAALAEYHKEVNPKPEPASLSPDFLILSRTVVVDTQEAA